jgi:hypothetical protein
MPKITSARMSDAHSAIVDFLVSLEIPFDADITLDADRNITGMYVYGTVTDDSFAKTLYNRQEWYVVTTNSKQSLCYCDNIYFYDDFDEYGNFLGRKVEIDNSVTVFSFGLPTDIVYSYNAGRIGFYYNRLIIDDAGCPLWLNFGAFLFGNGWYDGSENLITQKLKWYKWGTVVRTIDAYWGSLNNYEVVQIGNSYYFKIPNRNALFPGDGAEGTVKSPDIIVVQEEDGSVSYETASETELDTVTEMIQTTASELEWDIGFIYAEMLKQMKVKLEIA